MEDDQPRLVVWVAVDDAGFATVVVAVAVAVAIAADLVGICRQSEGMDLSWVFAAVQNAVNGTETCLSAGSMRMVKHFH
jgi:hypothetical protein